MSVPRDEQLDLVEQIAALALQLDRLCLEHGPLMPGYCDECGGSDCRDWECQAVRQMIPYSVESELGFAEMTGVAPQQQGVSAAPHDAPRRVDSKDK